MTIGKAIFAQLSTTAGINALIGTRVYPQTVPETSRQYPCIVYSGEEGEIDETYTGGSGVAFQNVKIACQATSFAAMDVLAKATFDALSDKSGVWGGVKVQGCFYEGEDEPAPYAVEGRAADFLIYERELSFHFAFNLN